MGDDYTPTTDEVRDRWGRMPHLRAQFGRWIAALRSEWEAEQARSEAIDAMSAYDDAHTEGYAQGRADALAERGAEEAEVSGSRVTTPGAETQAETRQGTEGSEWEYECRVDSAWDWRPCTEDATTCPRGSERRRRRRAGPWVPVEQEPDQVTNHGNVRGKG